ncbi:dihydroxyacetone/glyceraldehyde kinase [Candidatus Phytoplasma luffae]|uniref:Dihydroxyacetone/glyceraldehyde kinase n=1 Tax=Loofah witches'-broom phytoplasma TaxID=35773 RepID=A0A975FIJ8_LOWBP|nr:DAK2 domain-containing protein [Candidatus Phytoplasma luffae]QTX03135.1 dihydroxyacetone/glyceraldehyde kinase [Candidatus Phytoplasma luffae]
MSKQKIKSIDGNLFKKMIINGTFNLKKNYQQINNLNVFPVPDGDTGTNMQMTMMEGVRELQAVENSSILEISRILSKALLIGSKGNSGVILSQFFNGIYESINRLQKTVIDLEEFIEALVNGFKNSYKAVMEPVEGTILTVMRESIENTKNNSKELKTIKELIENIIQNAKTALNKTPDLLPILKKSKVVDSGGTGFVFILEGMLLYLNDVELKDPDDNSIFSHNHSQSNHINDDSNLKYLYCTEFIIKLNEPDSFDVELNKAKIQNYGDSLILFKNNDLLKIHIHTNDSDKVLKELLVYGTLIKSKIDDMKKQKENFMSLKDIKTYSKLNKYFIITFGSGEEIQNIFKDLKANLIIDSHKKNFSAEKLEKIINKNNAENIIILPNDSNILEQLKIFFKKKKYTHVQIINTQNIAEIYSALLVFDNNISLEKNIKNINKNIKKVKIGEIIDSKYSNEKEVKLLSHYFLSIFKKKIVEKNKDLTVLIKNLLKKMIDNMNNFLTIFYNKNNISKENLSKIEFFLEQEYPDLEVEKIQNNSEIYPFIFVLE